jgi:hypothetical protein
LIPQRLDHFAQARFLNHQRRHAETQSLDHAVQETQGRLPERRLRLTQIARESEDAHGLRREVMPERRFARRLRAAQEMRQALLAIEDAQAGGEIDPVPRLFELIVAQAALKLAFQDAAGDVGADFGQRANLIDEMRARTDARLDRAFAAVLEKYAKTPLGHLDGGFVEFARLKNLEVLPGDVRDGILRGAPALPAAPQKERREEQKGHDRCRQY